VRHIALEFENADYTVKNCVLNNRKLAIARNSRHVIAREKFAFIMLHSFMTHENLT
jgi:hypothetical protein